ncbi:MAG: DUF5615 family PIN-like protein [Phycisphaeraceae bacterium]
MRLLLDQGDSRLAAEILRQRGHDAIHVAEVSMYAATDEQIIERAVLEERVIVTWDADFHNHIVLSRAEKPSCIRIRIECLGTQDQANIIQSVIDEFAGELIEGAIVTVDEAGSRSRTLPVDR